VRARRCSRPTCEQAALSTLTYDYRDSIAVLGPLAARVEPNSYDLCATHAARLTAPRGWEVMRLRADSEPQEADDLEALADAVRETRVTEPPSEPVGQDMQVGRRGHLRVVQSSPCDRGRLE
jgi:hypothetical protein